mmetsp:Transcript_2323/g.5673  ORF Transcript_2323/g.5673 Transcript_2323/m.5673 type:complete len:222 (-) Transcript_2323:356-1021(-)
MSIPRAATSVATSTCTCPPRNLASASVRTGCGSWLCSSVARIRCFRRKSPTKVAVLILLTKMSTRGRSRPLPSASSVSALIFSRARTSFRGFLCGAVTCTNCRIPTAAAGETSTESAVSAAAAGGGTVGMSASPPTALPTASTSGATALPMEAVTGPPVTPGRTLITAGLSTHAVTTSCTAAGAVAEKRRRWASGRTLLATASTCSRNPSAISRSASSRTR